MENRKNRMDSRPDGRKTGGCRGGQSVAKVAWSGSGLNWIVALAVVLLASAGPALGQFTVQPMKFDLQITAGKLVPQKLEIHNIDPNEAHTIDVTVVDLAQSESGGWLIIEPNSGFDTSKFASLKGSIKLDRSSVTVAPGQTAPIEVLIGVPRGNRGFSCAGILATIRPRQITGSDATFRLRFMVPVIVQIADRPIAHRVQATDLGMEFVKAGDRGTGSPATTLVSMDIENTGGTFPRTRPVARVWSWAGGHWRVITTTGFQDISSDIGIIPGAKVKIKTDLKKTLPPGKYKIAGVLYVEGRRTRRIEKEIDFAGDPSVTRVAVDTPLDLDPDELTVDNLPGATRSTIIKVYNGSDETVNIQAALGLPRDMAGIVLEGGSVRGSELDCTPWVKVEPERFTLKGEGGDVSLRITSAMPQSGVVHPSYYANLDLHAFYPDGQKAGVTTAKICVQNSKAATQPKCHPISLTPYLVSGSKYQIVARFNNYGLTHFSPIKCKATITDLTSNIPRISAVLTGEARGYMLPGEERNFEGILDLATLEPGDYRLSVGMQYAEDLPWAQKQSQIRVTIEGDQRVIETTGIQEELPKVLEVKWSRAPERAITDNERG